jgi:hypothetical protein
MVIKQDDEEKRIKFDCDLHIFFPNRSVHCYLHPIIEHRTVTKLDAKKGVQIDYRVQKESYSIEFEDQKTKGFQDILSIRHN